ncbi:hypothetical protein MLD38_031257 [Melastoma candidum]|uniref:Uncharacterized protein n=1 Tax=Melastoma candidum TaxID=119954 RepID=A0ACB9MQB3_9MYRT|nr:hypothetical protein MLD38_031257 [Melastoma candidum]
MGCVNHELETIMLRPSNLLCIFVFIFSILLILCSTSVSGVPDTDLVYGICNENTTTEGSPIDQAINEVIVDLILYTFKQGMVHYTTATVDPYSCFGHSICHLQLNEQDCKACLRSAEKQIQEDCPLTIRADLQLVDCSIRFELYRFVE